MSLLANIQSALGAIGADIKSLASAISGKPNIGSATPAPLGVASAGASTNSAREDHVHGTTGLVTSVNGKQGVVTLTAASIGAVPTDCGYNNVGSLCFVTAQLNAGVSYGEGSTVSGGVLKPAEAAISSNEGSVSTTFLSGTWRLLGRVHRSGPGNGPTGATLAQRIA